MIKDSQGNLVPIKNDSLEAEAVYIDTDGQVHKTRGQKKDQVMEEKRGSAQSDR